MFNFVGIQTCLIAQLTRYECKIAWETSTNLTAIGTPLAAYLANSMFICVYLENIILSKKIIFLNVALF